MLGDVERPDPGENDGVKLGASGLSLFGLFELVSAGIATGALPVSFFGFSDG